MNKLSLNVKKTKAMLFHMPQKKIIIPTIKINGTLIEFVDNFNFLGINLNKHLNWNPHVTNVSNKLVKTVGVLNILKKTLPLNILRIIYNALILPHLNYGILAWGHLAKRLNLIQKRAVRILTASKYNSHTEPLFKQTNILKVTDICTLNEIKLYYKLINKQLPQYFNSFTCEANSDIHGYNTRTRNKLHTLKTNHDFAQKSLRYRIIQTINKLPDNVIGKMRTHSIYGLTNYANKYFISNYKTECTIENCYTCQCSMRWLSLACPSLVLSSNIFIFLIETSCWDLCLTVLMGGARASVCGRSGRFCQVCAFFPIGNPSVVQTWAGTDRVDVSVQLLVSFIIVLRYKCRPKVKTCEEILTQFTIIK